MRSSILPYIFSCIFNGSDAAAAPRCVAAILIPCSPANLPALLTVLKGIFAAPTPGCTLLVLPIVRLSNKFTCDPLGVDVADELGISKSYAYKIVQKLNDELKAVYTIGILNFCFDESEPGRYRHDVKLVDTGTGKVFYEKLTFIYLEMPKFNKREDELKTLFDKWLFVLRNLASLLDRPIALQERVFTRLFETAEIAKFSPKELYDYEESLKNFRDWYSVISTATKKGRREGRKEGLKEGRKEGLKEGLEAGQTKATLNIARNMKEQGMTTGFIAQITGLDTEAIEKL